MQTSGLVYADIGQATFNHQRHLLPGIPDLDDTPPEYAKINHNALVKPSVSQNHKDIGELYMYIVMYRVHVLVLQKSLVVGGRSVDNG